MCGSLRLFTNMADDPVAGPLHVRRLSGNSVALESDDLAISSSSDSQDDPGSSDFSSDNENAQNQPGPSSVVPPGRTRQFLLGRKEKSVTRIPFSLGH